MRILSASTSTGLLLAAWITSVEAADQINVKTIGMELARDLATKAIEVCREAGFQVSAVVVDRNGILRAALRDDFSSRFTLQIAEDKANAVVISGVKSGDFRRNRQDIRQEMNHVRGILMMEGGVPIWSGGNKIGALGVSGAPGGEKDEICAAKALEYFEERLEFGD